MRRGNFSLAFRAPGSYSLKMVRGEAMANGKSNEDRERQEDATDSRTLEDIEQEEKTSDSQGDSPALSPDDRSDRTSNDDAGHPM